MKGHPTFQTGRRHLAWALLILVHLLCGDAGAQVATNAPESGVTLKILNREVMRFRANLGSYSPEQRSAAAEVRIARADLKVVGTRVDSVARDGSVEVRVRGQAVFFILPGDVNELEGETLASVARQTVARLHAHIQDVFNKYGVQILSPHYEADPAQPVVVPKSKWHEPPAAPQ